MAKESRLKATGAVKMFDAANRLDKALKSGKVIAGPFASSRMFLTQLGSAMGFTGTDAISQTRQVIRSLAESSLEARKELAGQGQVTENEAAAVQKAMSGDIDSFTATELKDLVSLNRKAAKLSAEQHQYLINQMEQDPDLKGVARFYKVPGLDAIINQQTPNGGAKFLGFE